VDSTHPFGLEDVERPIAKVVDTLEGAHVLPRIPRPELLHDPPRVDRDIVVVEVGIGVFGIA
jgi:hypothetical protein